LANYTLLELAASASPCSPVLAVVRVAVAAAARAAGSRSVPAAATDVVDVGVMGVMGVDVDADADTDADTGAEPECNAEVEVEVAVPDEDKAASKRLKLARSLVSTSSVVEADAVVGMDSAPRGMTAGTLMEVGARRNVPVGSTAAGTVAAVSGAVTDPIGMGMGMGMGMGIGTCSAASVHPTPPCDAGRSTGAGTVTGDDPNGTAEMGMGGSPRK
jgi:hypothetical protein